MSELTVTKTKKYLILKIPIADVQRGKVSVSSRAQRAIAEGLKAYGRGRGAGPFTAKQAAFFLGKL